MEINDSVAMLRKKLEEAEDARSVLLQARKSLRQDIRFWSKKTLKIVTKMMSRVKETSLRIDEGKCLGQRLRFPYNQRCGRDCSFKYNYNQSLDMYKTYDECKQRIT